MTLQRFCAAALGALALAALGAAPASAHPLGNFTINHYAEIRVGERQVQLDVVIDMAEIPTFSERPSLDKNGDGIVDPGELGAARAPRCTALAEQLTLAIDGRPMRPTLVTAGLQLLPGAGGLDTLRTVCEFTAPMTHQTDPVAITFADSSYSDRIGWREIVVTGDGMTVSAPGAPSSTISSRLTKYPADLLIQPPDQRSVSISAKPGGSSIGPIRVPDAQPIGGVMTAASSQTSAVPGGVGEEFSSLIGTKELTPWVFLLSLLVAVGLGAVHAVSPGHGKTVMAAYLIGTRGRARHAIGLALAVTVSHTTGVVVLALVTLLASDLLPPERLYPVLGLASALTVVGIGAWLLVGRWRDLQHRRSHARTDDEHAHKHSHGLVAHRHETRGDAPLSWRGLVALGLAGGLVPSASALILLLGAVAAGRPAFGLALAIAFGVGMAVVLGGIGLVLAQTGRWLERSATVSCLAKLAPTMPWVTAAVVLVAGFVLTGQALTQRF